MMESLPHKKRRGERGEFVQTTQNDFGMRKHQGGRAGSVRPRKRGGGQDFSNGETRGLCRGRGGDLN